MSNHKKWNDEVERNVKSLAKLKNWLERWVDDPDTDWGSQKSAHQALRFIELAEYEMWDMQYWENQSQLDLHEKAEKTVAK